jgi:hypothetical protein
MVCHIGAYAEGVSEWSAVVVLKRDKVTGEWRRLITRNFMISAPYQILFG